MLLTTDRRFRHYKANEDRINLKDGLLFRKYYGETDSVKYYQSLIPKQLVNEVLRSLHGEFGKRPGITKTIIAYREKFYYPKMAQLIREWVMSCKQCIRELRINPRLTHHPLQNPNEYITAPELHKKFVLECAQRKKIPFLETNLYVDEIGFKLPKSRVLCYKFLTTCRKSFLLSMEFRNKHNKVCIAKTYFESCV